VVLVAVATQLEPGTSPRAERGSLTATEAGQLAAAAGARTLLLTHMWEELDFAAYHRRAAAAFPGHIELASPGLTITW
jgi:ribonuclease Z